MARAPRSSSRRSGDAYRMSLAAILAFAMFALIFAWLGVVLGATWRSMQDEAREAGVLRDRRDQNDRVIDRLRRQDARRARERSQADGRQRHRRG